MLTEKYGLKVADIDTEIETLYRSFLSARRYLRSRLRYIQDTANRQKHLCDIVVGQEGDDLQTTTQAIADITARHGRARRHLNALRAVLIDESEARADALQAKLL